MDLVALARYRSEMGDLAKKLDPCESIEADDPPEGASSEEVVAWVRRRWDAAPPFPEDARAVLLRSLDATDLPPAFRESMRRDIGRL